MTFKRNSLKPNKWESIVQKFIDNLLYNAIQIMWSARDEPLKVWYFFTSWFGICQNCGFISWTSSIVLVFEITTQARGPRDFCKMHDIS